MKKQIFFIALCTLINTTHARRMIIHADPSVENPYQYNEHNIIPLIAQYLPENPIVIEAGGRYGMDTKKMAMTWPKSTIHVFEPFPLSFDIMTKNVALLDNIHCYQLALSTKAGFAEFYVCAANPGASSISRPKDIIRKPWKFRDEPIKVPCTTIDDWAQQNNIARVDFMWLDMEGHELQALESGTELLKTVKVVYTEVNWKDFRADTTLYAELKAWLQARGFKEMWMWCLEDWQGNALFVRA